MSKKNWLNKLNQLIIFTFICSYSACKYGGVDDLELEQTASKDAYTKAVDPYNDLVKRWAPIHYMDVDVTGRYSENGASDYITAVDYDGDFNSINNWDNLPNYANNLTAHCYYSVVETQTHWYIIYAFFHPRDWTDIFFLYYLDQHENDMEGALMIVQKDGSEFGNLQGALTVNHSDLLPYVTNGSPLGDGRVDVEGELRFLEHEGVPHPVTAQEAKGHGLKAWPQYDIRGDGVIYYPSYTDRAEVPEDNYDTYVEYRLVDVFSPQGLWEMRFNTELFENPNGRFRSDFGDGGANAPWAWEGGDMAKDPAKLVDNYFDGFVDISHVYTSNRYDNTKGGVITLYQHCNYNGYAVALPVGNYTLNQLEALGIKNDDISSLRVESGYQVVLYEHHNFTGNTITKTSSDTCLGGDGFNDEMSSVSITLQ